MRIARVPSATSRAPRRVGVIFPLGLHPQTSHGRDVFESLATDVRFASLSVRTRQSTYDKLLAEVPKYKMISISILTDRLRITCSLARKAIAILIAKGLIKPVTLHSKQQIYTRATNDTE